MRLYPVAILLLAASIAAAQPITVDVTGRLNMLDGTLVPASTTAPATVQFRLSAPVQVAAADGSGNLEWVSQFTSTVTVTDSSAFSASLVPNTCADCTVTPTTSYYDVRVKYTGGSFEQRWIVPCSDAPSCPDVRIGTVPVNSTVDPTIDALAATGDTATGLIVFDSRLRLTPASLPATGVMGEMAVSADGDLYVHDGSDWVLQGAGAGLDTSEVLAGSGIQVGVEGGSVRVTNTGVLSLEGQGGITVGGVASSPQTGTLTVSQTYGTSASTAAEGNDSRIPTQSENDALVGTNGTPSGANPYVTDSDPRLVASTFSGDVSSTTNGHLTNLGYDGLLYDKDDTNTGITNPSADKVGVQVGGSELSTFGPATGDVLRIATGTLAAAGSALDISGTMANSAGREDFVTITGTAAVGNSGVGRVVYALLNGDHTGTNYTASGWFENRSYAPGTDWYNIQGGNFGVHGESLNANTSAHVGVSGRASNAITLNIGALGQALSSTAGDNVGGIFLGINSGAGTATGAYVGLDASDPGAKFVDAGLIVSNAAVAAPIQIWLDGSTTVGQFLDGGDLQLEEDLLFDSSATSIGVVAGEMTFTDGTAGTKTLAELAAGGGVTTAADLDGDGLYAGADGKLHTDSTSVTIASAGNLPNLAGTGLYRGADFRLYTDSTSATITAYADHVAATNNPHATDIENLGAGTLAELNDAITDANLDDAGDPRDPTPHASEHVDGTDNLPVDQGLEITSGRLRAKAGTGIYIGADHGLYTDSESVTIASMGGDITGPSNSVTVTKVQGYPLTYPTSANDVVDGDVWQWDAGTQAFILDAPPAGGSLTGQIAGGSDTTIDTLNVSIDGQITASFDGDTFNVSGTAGDGIQRVFTPTYNSATGTTLMIRDDTLPQSSEGTEFSDITTNITPTAVGNVICVEAVVEMSNSSVYNNIIGLYRNDEVDGVAVGMAGEDNSGLYVSPARVHYHHTVTQAGAITWKIRFGPTQASTVTVNGAGGSRHFSTAIKSTMECVEYKPRSIQ